MFRKRWQRRRMRMEGELRGIAIAATFVQEALDSDSKLTRAQVRERAAAAATEEIGSSPWLDLIIRLIEWILSRMDL